MTDWLLLEWVNIVKCLFIMLLLMVLLFKASAKLQNSFLLFWLSYLPSRLEHPGLAVRPAEQCACRFVADYLLGLWVPLDLSAGEHGDLSEQPNAYRAVADLRGADGQLSALDAVEEVLLVVVAFVEPCFSRSYYLFEDACGFDVQSASIDVYPAFFAIPFCPVGNLLVVCDGHDQAVGVFAVESVGGGDIEEA